MISFRIFYLSACQALASGFYFTNYNLYDIVLRYSERLRAVLFYGIPFRVESHSIFTTVRVFVNLNELL